MKRKFRKCEHLGCSYPVFAKNKCLSHYRRSKIKFTKVPIKSATLHGSIRFEKNISDHSVTLFTPFCTELKLIKWIWQTQEHVSFLSGEKLNFEEGKDYWFNLFAHILPKAQNMFPLFKLNPDNVILLTPHEHFLLDQGTMSQRQNYSSEWLKISQKAQELWNQYKTLVPDCSPLPNKYK